MLSYCIQKVKNQIIRLREWRDFYLFKKYKRAAVVKFDESFFQSKRVVLIGGANNAFEEKNGEFIDGFDIVVRVNKGVAMIEKYSDFIGTKTDLLIHSLGDNRSEMNGGTPVTVSEWKKYNVKNLLYAFNSSYNDFHFSVLKDFLFKTEGKYPLFEISLKSFLRLYEELDNALPTTGFAALSLILNSDFKELFITGLSFFRTPHNPDYREGNLDYWKRHFLMENNNHNPDAELAFLMDKVISFNDDRVRFDIGLKEIIKNELLTDRYKNKLPLLSNSLKSNIGI